MHTDEQREALDEVLSGTLSRTIDFLRYAETKNAALLTFASAWLVGLTTLLTGDRVFDRGPRAALAAALLLFALAAFVALRSFLPKLNLSSLHRDPGQPKNLLYFGHIAEFEPTAYATRVRERYAADPEVTVSDDYLHDLAAQVSANSIITKRKFNTFYFGAALATLAIGILAVTAMCMTYKFLWP
jgi:pycsar effector protein